MSGEERRIPPLSFVAQKLRDDFRLGDLRVGTRRSKLRDDRQPLFSATARLVVLMLASFVNRKDFTAWPSQETLARACGLDVRTLARHRRAIEIFFEVTGGGASALTFTFLSPDEFEENLYHADRLQSEANERFIADVTVDSVSVTPGRKSVAPGRLSTDAGLSAHQNNRENLRKNLNGKNAPAGRECGGVPSIASPKPLTLDDHVAFLRKQAN